MWPNQAKYVKMWFHSHVWMTIFQQRVIFIYLFEMIYYHISNYCRMFFQTQNLRFRSLCSFNFKNLTIITEYAIAELLWIQLFYHCLRNYNESIYMLSTELRPVFVTFIESKCSFMMKFTKENEVKGVWWCDAFHWNTTMSKSLKNRRIDTLDEKIVNKERNAWWL